ncbi:hypothetical protein I3842_05G060800 [Carya illinoinensis]|uniref:ResB-like domain-containing protein n=1 Tax=Carya illinoinensis TaxID=32201 RepID=A0A922EXQ5_CARIL|nr:hypothetical protein I3842_05G060800 [Carya illinoinensis]
MEALKTTKARIPYLPNTLFLKSNLLLSTFKLQPIPCSSKTRVFPVQEHLKTSKKIVLSEVAPKLGEERGGVTGNAKFPVKSGSGGRVRLLKRFPRRVLAILSNLPLAIGEMSTLAGLMALGTVIDQGEAPDFCFQKYPEGNPLLGFFTWRWVLTLGFDHMYTSPSSLGTLMEFLDSVEAIRKQEYSDILHRASVKIYAILMGSGYELLYSVQSSTVRSKILGIPYINNTLNAIQFAVAVVHLAMLLITAGGTPSATGSFRGSVTVPQGLNFFVGDVLGPSGFLCTPIEAFNTEVHVNRFCIDYYDSGEEVMRKTISVNDPLRDDGITIYQTDWSFSALQILEDDEGPLNLAMAPLKINGDKKLFETLPVDFESPNVKGMKGQFVGVRRPSSKLQIDMDGTRIIIADAIRSSGLDLKTDPRVPLVYVGFGALMLTTCISYLSHSQGSFLCN